MKTNYCVYQREFKKQEGQSSTEVLTLIGQGDASSAKQAVSLLVSEPRESTQYVAIPTRNITTVRPSFKPATVTWH